MQDRRIGVEDCRVLPLWDSGGAGDRMRSLDCACLLQAMRPANHRPKCRLEAFVQAYPTPDNVKIVERSSKCCHI